MRKITLLLILLASTQTSAAVNQWTSTSVQGVTEYHIRGKDGAELLLTCSPDDNVFVEYTAPDGKTLTSGNDDGRSVQAQVDSGDTFLINDTFSDAGGSNFEAFWDAARKSHRIHITATGLTSATFTFSNAAKILPKFDIHLSNWLSYEFGLRTKIKNPFPVWPVWLGTSRTWFNSQSRYMPGSQA